MAMTERAGAVTLHNNPFTLLGPEIKAGDKAPDFTVTGNDMKPVSLQDTAGKVRILSVVPSLDTPVCDQQTRRFNEEAGKLDRKSTRLNSSHIQKSRMPSSA